MYHRLNDRKKKMFFDQLRTLLRSGLSFSQSFSMVNEGSDDRDREILSSLFDRVISGSSLWEAMQKENSFTEIDCGVIRIGEETGRLYDALDFLSGYYFRKEEQKRMIINALSYPAITMCIAVAVLVFMLLIVVPMFQQVYTRMGGELPEITQAIIHISNAVPAILVATVIIALIILASKYIFGNTETYRRAVSAIILNIPIAGNLVKKYHLSHFCRLMYLMTSSGVPVLQSLNLIAGIMTFDPYKQSIFHAIDLINCGGSLADSIEADNNLYGRKFAVLVRVGEETNALDKILKNQAEDVSTELEFGIRQINNVLEPLLILCIGIIVAFVLIAMYMPMFRLGTAIY